MAAEQRAQPGQGLAKTRAGGKPASHTFDPKPLNIVRTFWSRTGVKCILAAKLVVERKESEPLAVRGTNPVFLSNGDRLGGFHALWHLTMDHSNMRGTSNGPFGLLIRQTYPPIGGPPSIF